HAITLSAYGGGVAGKTGAYLVNGNIRRLTSRECARVQGFPEWFKIPVSKSQAYKQFGNSVSVPVIDTIFKQIRNTLNNKNEILVSVQTIKKERDYSLQTQLIRA
ncbi:MAG: DNA cytosine methyltransferase, partial [Halanaerobiales bacterium]